MKERTWGISNMLYPSVNKRSLKPDSLASLQALADYKKNRENGQIQDNPQGNKFPNDGKYDWETPDAEFSKIKYTEGAGDRAWMREKDRNYLARLAREEKEKEQQEMPSPM